jgi:poly(3-hydroxybutyrate) depolymerase
MASSRWFFCIASIPLLGCAEPGGGDEVADESASSIDADTGDADTDDAEGSTSDATDEAESTQTSDTDSTTDTTSDDATTDTTDDTTETTETTGDGDACPSNGAGGGPGQAAIASAEYPNTPGVLYVPQSYDPSQATPVMLALHGSGDTAGNFVNLWAGIAEAQGFILLVPESLSGGASWNRGGDTPVIGALLDKVEADYNVDTCRVYLTGYSAGAHYGYMLGLANSTYFAALGIQAGTLNYAEQSGIWPGMVERQIAVDIHHGMNDPYVPIGEATHARAELEGAGHTVYYNTHSGGHEIGAGNPEEMWMNIANHSSME